MTVPATTHGFVERAFEIPRTVRFGALGDLGPTTRSVWCALHGYGERADQMAGRARWPQSARRTWLFPEAPHRFYVTAGNAGRSHAELPVGASWMTRELREHDIRDNVRFLDAVTDRANALAPQATLSVLGFSQGSATAIRWAASRAAAGRPPVRVVVWGSLLPPDVPLILVMGTRDRWVSEDRFAAELTRVADAGFPVRVVRFDGGHRFDDAVLDALAAEDAS